jgi:hypothetical protein
LKEIQKTIKSNIVSVKKVRSLAGKANSNDFIVNDSTNND